VRVVALLSVVVSAMVSACAKPPSVAVVPPDSAARDAERRRVVHALNRLTFGPRPGDVERVLRIGLDRWLDDQFRSDTTLDSTAVAVLGANNDWVAPVVHVAADLSAPVGLKIPSMTSGGGLVTRVLLLGSGSLRVVRRDSIAPEPQATLDRQNSRVLTGRLMRSEKSQQQVREVMTDFWENHFSLFSDRTPSRGAVVDWDRSVIRPNALGRFRDLLGAVAHHPAMLGYLDNALSTAQGLNENYARELLELHTLGVDGGYTQQDVIDVARAFTGWSHTMARSRDRVPIPPPGGLVFVFSSASHDTGAKTVLGFRLPAGRGLEDGEAVLDLLARHPSTAHFIARKLVKRFVSDTPPESLVVRAAATFRQTDGDISAVMHTIVTSAEFSSPTEFRSKIKNPIELVLSMRRVLGAPPDTAGELIDHLIALEQVPFSHVAPDGWPDGSVWLNAGAMRSRIGLALRVARGEVPSIPLERWPAWSTLSVAPFNRQIDGVTAAVLHGYVSTETRAALESLRPNSSMPVTADEREKTLRDLVALALASPEFQRR
jgi:uncharacterized protein (DUF1800 family)